MKKQADEYIRMLLAPRPMYDDKGAGVYNSQVLQEAKVRPAFFDTACLLYRLMFAKAKTYCDKAGGDDELLIHNVCIDFINDVVDACGSFACAPVLAFDSKRSLRKEQMYPAYKEGRGKQKRSEHETRVLGLRHDITKLAKTKYSAMYNIQSFCVNGYESDDIIASFVLGLKQQKENGKPEYPHQVVVATSDHDLHQLVLEGVFLADVLTGVLSNKEQIHKRTKIHPEHLVASKVIGGCASDAIHGIKGCGKVSVQEILKSGNSEIKQKRGRDNLQSEEGLAILKRNLKLIRLPLETTPKMPPLLLCEKKWPKNIVPDEAVALFESLGIERNNWPCFGDVTRTRPVGAIPMCEYKPKK